MFYVLKQTWFAGADPTDVADCVKQVGAMATREAAEAWAASLAQVKASAHYDVDKRSWCAKGVDAQHEFHVSDHPLARRR
jgi:hypothetical protein